MQSQVSFIPTVRKAWWVLLVRRRINEFVMKMLQAEGLVGK
jgi:hypothetical protein